MNATVQSGAGHATTTPDQLREQVIAALGRALQKDEGLEIKEEVTEAFRAAVRLRDVLLERRRQQPGGDAGPVRREALERVNASISLILSVEYPISSILKEPLRQAQDILRQAPLPSSAAPRGQQSGSPDAAS